MLVELSTDVDAKNAGLLPVKEAARKLSVSPRTIWRMIADGQLIAVRIRRCTRLRKAEIESCLARGN